MHLFSWEEMVDGLGPLNALQRQGPLYLLPCGGMGG